MPLADMKFDIPRQLRLHFPRANFWSSWGLSHNLCSLLHEGFLNFSLAQMGVFDCFKRRNRNKRKKKNLPLKFEDSSDSNGAKVSHPSVNKTKLLTSKRELAATQIQTAFRAYKARKMLSYIKRISRFQALMTVNALTKQAPMALERLHFWSKIQAEISGRRLCKVAEGRMKQMKLQNQMKVASKLHELEVLWIPSMMLAMGPTKYRALINYLPQMKWWSGPVTKEENGWKTQQIGKATNERTLAYAFSHQWRPNSSRCFGQAYYDLSKESWGWSWIEPWIVVYRLEDRVVIRPVVSSRARI
ncbi:hypothetical protein SSX86_005802 [Deinandra increscens subsp. villosa]|uniref:Uncharacterized protein n=1 Tax=Deinandra increscens subsp. villosa TaxID=3103831 RepID=A0AAP0DQK7_9ASTR